MINNRASGQSLVEYAIIVAMVALAALFPIAIVAVILYMLLRKHGQASAE